jgi:hypothetical protein
MPLTSLKQETKAMSSLDGAAATARGEPMTESYPPSNLDALTLRENAERAAYQIRLAAYQARCGEASADVAAMMSPVTIQEEDWFGFAPDGLPLAGRHYEEVRRDDDDDIDLNIPLIEGMARAGLLQIVTARAGGKLVGYLVFILSPSLVSRSEMEAVQSPFYVLPEWRGWTGLALHRESIRLLKEKGVKRLTLRSGVRGVGSRQDTLFRRISAQPDGRMWTLMIGEE